MPDPDFPGRSAPAANADVLGEEASNDGTLDGLAQEGKPNGAPRDPDRGQAKPGKDINQAGFLKDEDSPGKPGG